METESDCVNPGGSAQAMSSDVQPRQNGGGREERGGSPERKRTPTPWSVRLIERSGIEPLWLGLASGVALVCSVLAVEEYYGHVSRMLRGEVPTLAIRAPVVAMLLIGLAPAGHTYLVRWTRRSLEQIAPLVAGAVPAEPASAHPSRRAGWIGVVSFLGLFLGPDFQLRNLTVSAQWMLHNYYPWVMVGTLGWLMVRFMTSVLRDARLVSRLGERLDHVDLLDEAWSAPFVQHGLRSALLIVIVFTVTSVLSLDPGPRALGAAVALTGSTIIAFTALRRRIDDGRRAALDGDAESRTVDSLPPLLALEARLESVREWPFDLSTWARFALYVLLGLGSWVGAAAVERLLEWGVG